MLENQMQDINEISSDYTSRQYLNLEVIKETRGLYLETTENGVEVRNKEGKTLFTILPENCNLEAEQLKFIIDMANFGHNTAIRLANEIALVS